MTAWREEARSLDHQRERHRERGEVRATVERDPHLGELIAALRGHAPDCGVAGCVVCAEARGGRWGDVLGLTGTRPKPCATDTRSPSTAAGCPACQMPCLQSAARWFWALLRLPRSPSIRSIFDDIRAAIPLAHGAPE